MNSTYEPFLVVYCEYCNTVHSANSATCLQAEFDSLELASDTDLFEFEANLEED